MAVPEDLAAREATAVTVAMAVMELLAHHAQSVAPAPAMEDKGVLGVLAVMAVMAATGATVAVAVTAALSQSNTRVTTIRETSPQLRMEVVVETAVPADLVARVEVSARRARVVVATEALHVPGVATQDQPWVSSTCSSRRSYRSLTSREEGHRDPEQGRQDTNGFRLSESHV